MGNNKAIGRINPETGELEFQGSNKMWLPSGLNVQASTPTPTTRITSRPRIRRPNTMRLKPVPKPREPTDEMIRRAMYGLCEIRAGID